MEHLRKLWDNAFIKHNIIFFLGSMSVAVLNYLYHPVLGRLMSIEDFGEVQVLISLALQLGIPIGVFNIIAINIVANQTDRALMERKIQQLFTCALYVVGAACLVFLALIPQLTDTFHFTSAYSFVALVCLAAASLPYAFHRAYLQGVQDFNGVSWSGIVVSGGRLALGALLVVLGFAAFGAIAAIVLSQILAALYTYYRVRVLTRCAGVYRLRFRPLIWFDSLLRAELLFGILIFFATGFVTLLYTADVVFIKYYFSPEVTGAYGGIATIARIIFFATGSIAAVLLAMVKLGNSKRENLRLLFLAAILVGGIGGSICLLFTLIPQVVVGTLIGSRYETYATILPRLSLVLLLVSFINLFFFYYLALRRYILIPIALIGSFVVIVFMAVNHATPAAIVDNFLWGSIVSLILIVLYGLVDAQGV